MNSLMLLHSAGMTLDDFLASGYQAIRHTEM